MKPRTIEHMQYFVGKVCSIVTTAMNRAFDERVAREHFVVLVEEVGPDGIWGTHPFNKDLVSFFHLTHLISIHQEEVLDPANPEHARMLKEFEQQTGKKAQGDMKAPAPKPLLPVLQEAPPKPKTGDATFIDIDSLERLAETSKRAFEHQLP